MPVFSDLILKHLYLGPKHLISLDVIKVLSGLSEKFVADIYLVVPERPVLERFYRVFIGDLTFNGQISDRNIRK